MKEKKRSLQADLVDAYHTTSDTENILKFFNKYEIWIHTYIKKSDLSKAISSG